MKKFSTFLSEETNTINDHVDDFLQFALQELGLEQLPEINLINDKKLASEARSFGGYRPYDQSISINIAGRHMADVFRTLAHELVHYKQDIDNRLDENSGVTGSDIENEANAMAGIIMRNYAQHNEQLFEGKALPKVKDPYRYKGKARSFTAILSRDGGAPTAYRYTHPGKTRAKAESSLRKRLEGAGYKVHHIGKKLKEST